MFHLYMNHFVYYYMNWICVPQLLYHGISFQVLLCLLISMRCFGSDFIWNGWCGNVIIIIFRNNGNIWFYNIRCIHECVIISSLTCLLFVGFGVCIFHQSDKSMLWSTEIFITLRLIRIVDLSVDQDRTNIVSFYQQ